MKKLTLSSLIVACLCSTTAFAANEILDATQAAAASSIIRLVLAEPQNLVIGDGTDKDIDPKLFVQSLKNALEDSDATNLDSVVSIKCGFEQATRNRQDNVCNIRISEKGLSKATKGESAFTLRVSILPNGFVNTASIEDRAG